MRLAVLTLVTVLFACPATAAPITVACDLQSSTTYGTRFIEADQFVYDGAEQSVDMRSAKTVGTSDLVNWLFVTRKTQFFDDDFVLRTGDGWFVGAGIYGGHPVAMRLTAAGKLTMTYLDGDIPQVIIWQCKH